MTFDEKLCSTPEDAKKTRQLCDAALQNSAAHELLARLCAVQHPFAPTISATGPNDLLAVGVREGRRETIAWLCKMAGLNVR